MRRIGTPDELAATLDFRHGSEVARIKIEAVAKPWTGQGFTPSTQRLLIPSAVDRDLMLSMIYTFDQGAHASGWWKNSDYESCRHLSMAAFTRDVRRDYAAVPELDLQAWSRVWFGVDLHKAWNEPPAIPGDEYRNAPASAFTNHVRVFVDKNMNSIIPSGEVYTLLPFDDGSSPEKVFR